MKDPIVQEFNGKLWISAEHHVHAVEKAVEAAKVVAAAAEREKVAQWMMQKGYATGHGETTEDLLAELDWQIAESWTKSLVKGVEGEREACAKLCDDLDDDLPDGLAGWQYGEAIRARGQE